MIDEFISPCLEKVTFELGLLLCAQQLKEKKKKKGRLDLSPLDLLELIHSLGPPCWTYVIYLTLVFEIDKQRLSKTLPVETKPRQQRNDCVVLLLHSILSTAPKITTEIVNQTPFSLFIPPKIQAD